MERKDLLLVVYTRFKQVGIFYISMERLKWPLKEWVIPVEFKEWVSIFHTPDELQAEDMVILDDIRVLASD